MAIADLYFTVDQASNNLSINEATMRRWLEEYRIPIEKFGQSVAILKEDIKVINKYKIIAAIRQITGIEEPKICDKCMNEFLAKGTLTQTELTSSPVK